MTGEGVRRILFDQALDVFHFDRATLAPQVERVGLDLALDLAITGG